MVPVPAAATSAALGLRPTNSTDALLSAAALLANVTPAQNPAGVGAPPATGVATTGFLAGSGAATGFSSPSGNGMTVGSPHLGQGTRLPAAVAGARNLCPHFFKSVFNFILKNPGSNN